MYATTPVAPGASRLRRLQTLSAAFATITLLLSLLVLAGWNFNISVLKGPATNKVLMNPVTALSLSLLSIASLLINVCQASRNARIAGRVLLLAIMVIAIWKLLNSAGLIDKQVDYLLFYLDVLEEVASGKLCIITPVSVACIFLTSLGLWLLPVRKGAEWIPAQYVALIVIAIAFFSLLSHLYRIHAFYGIFNYIPMALYSAISFTLLSLSILTATRESGLMDIFSGTRAGNTMARFVVPTVVLVPALFGLLRLYGHWAGLFTTEFGVAVLVLGSRL